MVGASLAGVGASWGVVVVSLAVGSARHGQKVGRMGISLYGTISFCTKNGVVAEL